ncbi:hypothetical protein [Archangium lansingense]|uniref:MYXO-CTERM domain-containing protein n=1 Tax=Archangium lansingense TaxID=2995310 RepID=A0ABT4A2Y1_9BACT|nr:hypothetical protein [Archangium lansinium]MCY1076000.1 hypothetical protein [Archangium lansinium]
MLLLVVAPFAAWGVEDRLKQSSELEVSTPVVGEPSATIRNPVITRGQDESLVVWADQRDEREWHLYGAWVGSDGAPQGNTFLIGAEVPAGSAPLVAFNGTDYLVVWAGRDPADVYQWRVWGQRVSRSTGVREARPFAITSGERTDIGLAAANGVWFVVFAGWGSDATKGDIHGVRVSAAGEVLDASPFPVSHGANDEQQVAVGSNGTGLLVAWQDQHLGLRCARVSSSGDVATTVMSLSTSPGYPAGARITSDGERFLVTWNDEPGSKTWGMYGVRVDANGALVGAPFLIDNDYGVDQVRIAYDGTRYMVVFGDWRFNDEGLSRWFVQAVRIGTDGTVLDSPPLRLAELDSSDLARPAVAREGNGFRVVWNSGARLISRTITTDGLPAAATTQLNRPFNSQSAPAVAFDGHQFLIVWEDGRSGVTNIYATRMLPDGTSLDGAGFPLSAYPAAQRQPAVTFDGTHFVVAWEDKRSGNMDLYAARVGTDGSLVDPEGFRVAGSPGAEQTPALASDGQGGVLAAWVVDSGSAQELFGARLSGGTVVPLSGSISGQASVAYTSAYSRNLTVSYGGGSYLVAWVDRRRGGSHIWGARLSATTGAVETSPFSISAMSSDLKQPVSAFDGTDFLVLWVGGATARSFGAQRISVTGVPQGSPLALGDSYRPDLPPGLAFDGSDFVVAWEVSFHHLLQSQSFSPLGEITGNERIDPTPGRRLDTYRGHALASGPAGQSLLVYTRYDSQPANAFRLGARLLSNSGPAYVPDAGTPPETPEEPGSGCGCTSTSGGLWLVGALLAWAGAMGSRRKRA